MQADKTPADELTMNEFNAQVKLLVHFIQSIIYQYRKGLRRYWLVMAALLLIIAAGTITYFSLAAKTFEGKASYAYTSLQRKLYGEAIDNVNTLLQSHSYAQLQQVLHINNKQLKSLQEIKATNNYGSLLSDDLTENNNKIFYISAKSTSYAAFDSLSVILENYLNNNVAVKELQTQLTEKFKRAIAYREKELVSLDSLTHAYTNSLSKPSTSMFASQKDPVNTETLFEKGEKITEEIADMQSFLRDPRAVRLQRPFLVSEVAEQRPAIKIAAIILLAFLVVSGALVFLLSIFKKPAHVQE